ncbi:hypothetical protein EJ03DRAFT_385969 [Teratosphaeria nubilosa]|uniref:Apple domain-containing protein n=1 Tax=Teratosphaeria nubilosa TaxID=161662 RepID=A0A6G1KUV4_9PEZI|nr:hypothetical protein EJ03DRAFT_385969 [Teratosphaeria nubilosa]
MGSTYVDDSLFECLTVCDSTPGCVDVSLSGAACYLKSTLGKALYDVGIQGARLLTSSTSSSASLTSSSTTASPTATGPTCPQSNNTVWTDSTGDQYMIECGIDRAQGDIATMDVSSLGKCIATCSSTWGCVDVSLSATARTSRSQPGPTVSKSACVALTLSGSACYEKSVLNDAVYAEGMYAARLITSAASSLSATATSTSTSASATPTYVTCPASNGTSYTAANGEVFVVECDIDRPGGDLAEVDMTGTVAERLQQCIDTCANTTDCLDVTLSGLACYLKYILEEASYTEGMLGARYIGNASTPAVTSASSHFTYSPSSGTYASYTSMAFGYAPSGRVALTTTGSSATSALTEVETAVVSPVPAGRSVEHLLRHARRVRKNGA